MQLTVTPVLLMGKLDGLSFTANLHNLKRQFLSEVRGEDITGNRAFKTFAMRTKAGFPSASPSTDLGRWRGCQSEWLFTNENLCSVGSAFPLKIRKKVLNG